MPEDEPQPQSASDPPSAQPQESRQLQLGESMIHIDEEGMKDALALP